MNSSKLITMISITVLIMLLIIPVQSMATRYKRWTFNSWRLHGHPSKTHLPTNPTTEPYSPTISTDVNQEDQPVNIDNDEDSDSYKMLLRLLQFFQMLDYEEKDKNNGYD